MAADADCAWNARWLMVRQAGNADGIRRGPPAGQRPVPAAAVSQTPTSAPLHDIAGTPAATACSSLAPQMRRQKWEICA